MIDSLKHLPRSGRIRRRAGGTVYRPGAAADRAPGRHRSGALPVLLRRAMHPHLPVGDRRRQLHPQHPRPEHQRRRARHPEANILGGSCARVCPTEILCEDACVRNHDEEGQPVKIGLLQRHALDHASFAEHPFQRAPLTGKHIAIVGAGPAGLSCAHRLAMLGNDVVIFEAREKSGGLNEYGIAKYKLTGDFAQQRSRLPAVDRRHRSAPRPHPRREPELAGAACAVRRRVPRPRPERQPPARPDRRRCARPDGGGRLHRRAAPGRATWPRCRCRNARS